MNIKFPLNLLINNKTKRSHLTQLKFMSSCLKESLYKNYNKEMATGPNLLKPPASVCGLKTINKELFNKEIMVPCLILENIKISSIIPAIKKYLLKLENFKPIESNGAETLIHLNPEIVSSWKDLSNEEREVLGLNGVNEANFELRPKTLTYDNYSLETIFKAVLPNENEGFSSFTRTGHIVHVNLRDHLIPFKEVIGEVLFDKVHGCKSVVNKLDSIDNTYRNFKMEVLRGTDNFLVEVKENKCTFAFDFSKVYWNSRLCTEHERIVKMIKSDDVLFDVFAGVGPFSIPIAKKKSIVYANDLNPESFKWLNQNTKNNKISSNYLKSYNKDGRDFILEDIKENLPHYLGKNNIFIVMNLPALAVEFLKYFKGLYRDSELPDFDLKKTPLVICYCFAKGEDSLSITKKLITDNIGDISDKIIEIFKVRTVSNFKEMMRVTFTLDRDILVGSSDESNDSKRKNYFPNPSNKKKSTL